MSATKIVEMLVIAAVIAISHGARSSVMIDPGAPGPRLAVEKHAVPEGFEPLSILAADVDGDHREEIVTGCATEKGGTILAFPVVPVGSLLDPVVPGTPFTVVELPFAPDLLAARRGGAPSILTAVTTSARDPGLGFSAHMTSELSAGTGPVTLADTTPSALPMSSRGGSRRREARDDGGVRRDEPCAFPDPAAEQTPL